MKHLLLAVALSVCPLIAHAADDDLLKPATPATKPAATQPATRVLLSKVSPEAHKLLDESKAAYAKLSTLKLTGTIVFESDVAGKRNKQFDEFTATYAGPNKFRHEVKGNMLAGSTGEKAYVLSVEDNVYVLKDAPKDCCGDEPWPAMVWDVLNVQNPSLTMALSPDAGRQLLDDVTAMARSTLRDAEVDYVEKGTEVVRAPDTKMGDVACPTLRVTNVVGDFTAVIDPTTHLLRRLSVDERKALEKAGQPDVKLATLTFDYATTEIGPKVDDALFAWSPPADARELTSSERQGTPSPLLGKPAPAFKLKDLSGKDVTLAEQKGSVVVLDFWATWCPPCVESIPVINTLYEQRKDSGLKVLAISVDDDKEPVTAFAASHHLTLPILMVDEGQVTSEAYGVHGFPTVFVVGKDGLVKKVFKGFGPATEEQIAKAVDEASK